MEMEHVLQSLVNESVKLLESYKECKKEKDAILQDLDKEEGELEDLKNQKKHLEKELEEIKARNTVMRKQVNEKKTKLMDLKKEVDMTGQVVSNLRDALHS